MSSFLQLINGPAEARRKFTFTLPRRMIWIAEQLGECAEPFAEAKP
jgi:hypothetical protein